MKVVRHYSTCKCYYKWDDDLNCYVRHTKYSIKVKDFKRFVHIVDFIDGLGLRWIYHYNKRGKLITRITVYPNGHTVKAINVQYNFPKKEKDSVPQSLTYRTSKRRKPHVFVPTLLSIFPMDLVEVILSYCCCSSIVRNRLERKKVEMSRYIDEER